MVTSLRNAKVDTCGGKAAALATLLRSGLPVPDGFVVPFSTRRAARCPAGSSVPEGWHDMLARQLARLGNPAVAVRSSAADEDTARASGAGQYESVLAVRGARAVIEAVRVCWRSSSSTRAADYRRHPDGEPDMAVLVQRLVDADVSGVMFTPAQPGDATRIEASWGLGPSVVEGRVTPDTYEVSPKGVLRRSVGHKTTRVDRDRDSGGVTVRTVPERLRTRSALDDATVTALAALGGRIAALLHGPQDIEWAIADGQAWILQARPITAPIPSLPAEATATEEAWLTGTPGSHGVATGVSRVLFSPSDFALVQSGDIAICPFTDPAWTPLFRVAAAVVTETGGVLSHAAIVAREHGIPAVLGIPQATARIPDGTRITVDGSGGTVTAARD